jgi:Glycosyl transferase 4-like domain
MQLMRDLLQTANDPGRRSCESLGNASTQISLRPSRANSPEANELSPCKQVFPWKVIHACEQVRDVLNVVESQLAVGMRPFLVTPTSFGSGLSYLRCPIKEKPKPISLLQAWSDVRNWKRLLVECDSQNDGEILHAHGFAAGMAAVRSDAAVVYDLQQLIDQIATEDRSWLRRSFQAAEQFVLTRAAAVVVHSNELRQECLRRGIAQDDLFLIPRPLDSGWLESVPDRRWIEQRTGAGPGATIFFVPELTAKGPERDRQLSRIIKGLIFAHGENNNVKLLFLDNGDAEAIHGRLQTEKLRDLVQVLPETKRDLIFASCDVVILCGGSNHNFEVSLFAEALARGRALLAASKSNLDDEVPATSCLWFRSEEQLGYQMAFLARNPDLCRVMATKGWRYLASTRSPQAIGRSYDEVYNHVAVKRKQKETKSKDLRLVPLHVNL